MKSMARTRHLLGRFFGSLVVRNVTRSDRLWVETILTAPEYQCWLRLSRADAVESVAVARRFEGATQPAVSATGLTAPPTYGSEVIAECVAAALLHDVGKLDCQLGTIGRALATIAGGIAGHEMADAWSLRRGVTRRFGLYLRHGELGEQRVIVCGGRTRVARWAAAHHDPTRWEDTGIPLDLCRLLAIADGERVATGSPLGP